MIFLFLRAARHVSKVKRLLIDSFLDMRIGMGCLFEIMREHAVLEIAALEATIVTPAFCGYHNSLITITSATRPETIATHATRD